MLILPQSVQLLSRVQLFATPLIAACQASLSYHQLLESTQTHVHWVGDVIQPSHPLLSPSPPALNLSQHLYLFTSLKKNFYLTKKKNSMDKKIGKNFTNFKQA